MKRSIIARSILLLGLSASITGCTQAAKVCDLICTCEHCNDQDKVEYCNDLETAYDVADAYACGDAWNAYMVCFEERGTCDETEARFSVRNDAGENRCQKEEDAYLDCVTDASAHDGSDGNFN
ncbi:MAG: hypothetical protein IPM54_31740 [Polyangiaceae bacterium]|nr:hypothetical protein [Polyangiaceae bacterium]